MAAVTVNADAVYGVMPDTLEAGVVLCRSAQYVNDGAKDANSVVKMLKVPAGAKLLGIGWKSSALGTARTIDIGVDGTVDKYVDGADVSSAATGEEVCINEDLSDDITIQIKVLGDTLPDAAQLDLNAYYKMNVIEDES